MVIGIPVNVFIDTIGHDGSEIINPNEPEPRNRRSFTLEEMFYTMFHFGYACSLYPKESIYSNGCQDDNIMKLLDMVEACDTYTRMGELVSKIKGEIQVHNNSEMITDMMRRFNGVALVDGASPHAVGWNTHSKVYHDPVGLIYPETAYADKICWFIPCINIGHFSGRGPGKYGFISSSKKDFHLGEPIFLGRSTDKLMPYLQQIYVNMLSSHGAGYRMTSELTKNIEDMFRWQYKNPSLVKMPD